MTAPNEIFASQDDDGWRWPRASKFPEQGGYENISYTRTDLYQAAIAAAMLGAVDKLYAASASNNYFVSKALSDAADFTKASTPADATAALEAVKAQVREDVAAWLDTLRDDITPKGAAILLRKGGE